MNVTAGERRNVLKLFNVSEAARQLGVPVQEMHRTVRAGRLPSPRIRLGRRLYYRADDLKSLAEQCAEMQNHP